MIIDSLASMELLLTLVSILIFRGSYGIWLDGDLNHGRTQNCLTYANDPLTGALEDFQIDHIEIWSFHDDF